MPRWFREPLKPSPALRAARGPEETMGAAVTRDRCALLSLRALLPSDWRRALLEWGGRRLGLLWLPREASLIIAARHLLQCCVCSEDPNAQNLLSAQPDPPFKATSFRRWRARFLEEISTPALLGKDRIESFDARILQLQPHHGDGRDFQAALRRRGDGGGGALPRDDGELSKVCRQSRAPKRRRSFVLKKKGGRINEGWLGGLGQSPSSTTSPCLRCARALPGGDGGSLLRLAPSSFQSVRARRCPPSTRRDARPVTTARRTKATR